MGETWGFLGRDEDEHREGGTPRHRAEASITWRNSVKVSGASMASTFDRVGELGSERGEGSLGAGL